MRSSKPITVTLGPQQRVVDALLANGTYSNASEVLRAGLRALEREEDLQIAIMRAKVQEALNDPRPGIPMEEVFARLEKRHQERMAKGK